MSALIDLRRASAGERQRWRRELATFESLALTERCYAARTGEMTAELVAALDALDAADAVLISAKHALEDAARVLAAREPDIDELIEARAYAARVAGEIAFARRTLARQESEG